MPKTLKNSRLILNLSEIMRKKQSLLIVMVMLLLTSLVGMNNLNAECTNDPAYNNGKRVTVQGECQCDETSRRQQCYQTPPDPELESVE